MDSYVAELPAILDIFSGYANTTSTPIGVEGRWWWGAMKWWGATKWQAKGTSELNTAKWHLLVLRSFGST